jgi:putative intracellular protease/amidase
MNRTSLCTLSFYILTLALHTVFSSVAAAAPKKVLFVVTASDHLTLKDGTRHRTGFYAQEFAVPWKAAGKAGHTLAVATPGGKPAPVDPRSLEKQHFGGDEKVAAEAKAWLAELPELNKPLALESVKAAEWDAVFVPGGHGPMEDLTDSAAMGALLKEMHAAGKPLGLLCHGPGALLSAGPVGWPFKGYKLTAFSDAEEPGELGAKMRTTPESALKALGAVYEKNEKNYAPHVVTDRNLVTGQNPASAEPIAEAFVKLVGQP